MVPAGPVGARSLLARFPQLNPPVATAGAAVTIVLRDGTDDVEILLIERATNPADAASGQVALPGGRVDGRDGSLADTALRELEEEVGIAARDVRDSLRFVRITEARRFAMHVGVFAAELTPTAGRPTPANTLEVAHVFWLPSRRLSETRSTRWQTGDGAIDVRATLHDGHVLWGFTRRVLREFFDLPEEDGPGGPVFAHRPPEAASADAPDESNARPL